MLFSFHKSRWFVLPKTPHPRYHGFCHRYSSDLPGRVREMDMPDTVPVLNPSLCMELLLFLTMRIMGVVWFMTLLLQTNLLVYRLLWATVPAGGRQKITVVGLTCCFGMPPGERETEQVSAVVAVQIVLPSHHHHHHHHHAICLNTFTAIVDLSPSNFSIARTPLFQLKSAM